MISDWALPPDVLQALDDRLADLRPVLAVESGSGESTIILNRHAQLVATLEHDPAWAEHTIRRLQAHRQTGEVWVRDIVSVDTPVGPLPWYDTILPEGIDFALIDGPPCRIGRGAAGFQIFPLLNPGAEVWVDDYGHSPHQKAVRSWVKLWGRHFDFTVEDKGRYAILR